MNNSLEDILNARDERWIARQKLARRLNDGCLISVTLCVPLPMRNTDGYQELFKKLCEKLMIFLYSRKVTIKLEKTMHGLDGPVMFFSTSSPPEFIKKFCVIAEESIPGARLLDVDVTGNTGEVIGREQLGLPPRKCFICSNPAHICVSRRLHSSQDIAQKIKKLYEESNKNPTEDITNF